MMTGIVKCARVVGVFVSIILLFSTPGSASNDASNQLKLIRGYGKLPLSFEANRGQADGQVKFLARCTGYLVFLTPTEAVLSLANPRSVKKQTDARETAITPQSAEPSVIHMEFLGANKDVKIEMSDELPGKSNYFIGNNPQKWISDIPTYAKVRYKNIYPNINLVYYGNLQRLEYDFEVAAGADPKLIRFGLKGVKINLDGEGNLILESAAGKIRQTPPKMYQEMNGVKRQVTGRFVQYENDVIGFDVAAYDRSKPLYIDPVLDFAYSTYLGGEKSDSGTSIAVDSSGSAYVAGITQSPSFPITPGIFQKTIGGYLDAFVTKLSPDGKTLVYSTYLGGASGDDQISGITIDGNGSAYVTGYAFSPDFPVTLGAFQTKFTGGYGPSFVTKLSPDGKTLAYSTFLGGPDNIFANGIAVDGSGSAYVTGGTSSGFPVTPGAFQTTYVGKGKAFVAKLDSDGKSLIYGTYLGGSDGDVARGIAVDLKGSAYVVGYTHSSDFPVTPGGFQTKFSGAPTPGWHDAFVTKLSPDGKFPLYSTYLGGSGSDIAYGVAVDSNGSTYVSGHTDSIDFPVTPGAFQKTFGGGTTPGVNGDAFATKLSPDGKSLIYSTYLGGISNEQANDIAVDAKGSAYVTGWTTSTDFPVTPDAFQKTFGGGVNPGIAGGDVFVAKIGTDGKSLIYSTYLGGEAIESASGIAVDSGGSTYVAGSTLSFDFPVTPDSFQTVWGNVHDAFIVKFGPGCPAPDQCHNAPTPDAQGNCPVLPKPDGTACDDGNLCTQKDICQVGICVGTNPVTCAGADQCHDGGSCDALTGKCSSPTLKLDNSACDLGSDCSLGDYCKTGVCTAGTQAPYCGCKDSDGGDDTAVKGTITFKTWQKTMTQADTCLDWLHLVEQNCESMPTAKSSISIPSAKAHTCFCVNGACISWKWLWTPFKP